MKQLLIKKIFKFSDLGKSEGCVYKKGSINNILSGFGLILGCPKCGFVSTGTHFYDIRKKTLTPSIVCSNCDYHGFLTNGEFTDV